MTMKPTPTPEMIEAAAEAIYNLFTYDEPGEKPKWIERGNSFKQEDARRYAAAALSVPASAAVGEPVAWRWSFDGGDTWSYGTLKPGKMRFGDPDIVEPLYAAPSAPDGYVEQLEKALKLAADRLDASSHRVGENDSRAAFGIAQWAIEARAALGGKP